MSLKDVYNYEQLDNSQNHSIKQVPLLKWSGPQYAKTDLAADLLFQLDFCTKVNDVLSYPIILNEDNIRIAGDVIYTTFSAIDGYGQKVLLVIHNQYGEIDEICVASARLWCLANHCEFRIIGKDEIQTAYLANARSLSPMRTHEPDSQCEAVQILFGYISNRPEKTPATVAQATMALLNQGIARAEAKDAIERCIAYGWILCNLDETYGDHSLLWEGNGIDGLDNRSHPLLRRILDAPRR